MRFTFGKKKTKAPVPASPAGKTIHPDRDWRILLAVFAVLLLAAVVFDGVLYQDIASGDMYVTVSESSVSLASLRLADLQTLAKEFDARAAALPGLKPTPLVDPSR